MKVVTFGPLLTAFAFFIVLGLSVWPLGTYLEAVYAGRNHLLARLLGPLERAIYRLCRIDAEREMHWTSYSFALPAMGLLSVFSTYVALRVQALLPLNPQHFGNLAPDLAWNTATSFATTTDWPEASRQSRVTTRPKEPS